jgi:allophanate hydrolase subunit 2
MTAGLEILALGPGASVQDRGRPGLVAHGLQAGGAADPVALDEGAALLGQDPGLAALELPAGGRFRATAALRIALTGAPAAAAAGGRTLAWNTVHRLAEGEELALGAPRQGVWSYLHLGGGIDLPPVLGARAFCVRSGIGHAPGPGALLPCGPDPAPDRHGLCLPPGDRFAGGTVRLIAGAQTALFPEEERRRFEAAAFGRDPRSDRMAARLVHDGAPFRAQGHRGLLSDAIVPGDVQVTGEGEVLVLMPDCQTTGGYPRLGTVVPDDLPRVAQAGPGAVLRFRFVPLVEARAGRVPAAARRRALARAVAPSRRDPRDIPDLLAYQLIAGVADARAEDGGGGA